MSALASGAPEPPRSVLSLPKLPPFLRRNLPWLLLIVLSITFAEFLTGSTPVLLPFVNPLSAVFLVGLYGAGVLLVREASIRWDKGWPTILLLGVAYGIAEEGLGTKTFFGPAGVGVLGSFGHFAGVNWVWAAELALFHAVFSIALPIAVVALIFPDSARVPFLPTRRALGGVLAVFLLTVAAMFALFNPGETPGAALLLASVAAIGLLLLLGRYAPARLAPFAFGRTQGGRGPLPPVIVGGLFVWGFFGLAWLSPVLLPVPFLVVTGLVAWSVAFGWYIASHAAEFEVPSARFAFVFGALTFSLVLATIWGFLGDFGAIPVVLAVILVSWRLRRRLGIPLPSTLGRPSLGPGPTA
jgi:hypothetical protein